jgi:hypothetical protein
MKRASYEAALSPVPEQKTLVMVNTFVAQTVQLLNRLSNTCESKLAHVQR